MKLRVLCDIKYYFKKGDIVDCYSEVEENSNYILILYRDSGNKLMCVNSFWKYNFAKLELNKNTKVL